MAVDSNVENWGDGSWLESRNPDDPKKDKYKKAVDDPDASIYSYNKDRQKEAKSKFDAKTIDEQKKETEETKTYNKLVLSLGNNYSPEVLEKASAKYFESAAQENPADIKDPKQRAVIEAQNKQVEKVCKVLGEVSDGGSKNDVLKNAFFEYVKDVELARGIAEMEKTLSPYSTSTASGKDEEGKTKSGADFKLLRAQAMRDNPAKEGDKMYKLPVAGNVESVEMTREGMTKYSAMLRAKVEEMNQGNKEKAELASLDKKLAGRIEKGAEA